MLYEVITSKTHQDTQAEIERIFALQRDRQWKMKATTAAERKARLEKLKAAVAAHGDEIVAAVQRDTRKPEAEIRVTEFRITSYNVCYTKLLRALFGEFLRRAQGGLQHRPDGHDRDVGPCAVNR